MTVFADQGPVAAMLADGRRLHLQHGPIDLIIEAYGEGVEVATAYEQAISSFKHILSDLVGELDLLRQCARLDHPPLGAVAKLMWRATNSKSIEEFVTPMAAVAGAVSDYVLAAMCEGRSLQRAYVNNGGDIAIHLGAKETFHIALCTNAARMSMSGAITISAVDGVGGVATSGWEGRSQSLGIADAVTVLAEDAASADSAATLIANAVDLKNSNKVERQSAREINPESDLGERKVTISVAPLTGVEVEEAIYPGLAVARRMIGHNQIKAAFIYLQGMARVASGLNDTMPLNLKMMHASSWL